MAGRLYLLPSLFSLRILEKKSQHKFTKFSISLRDWKKGRGTNRAQRHQEGFILDSVSLGWCQRQWVPAIPLVDLQLHYKPGIRSWVLRLFPPALQQRKGGSFTQNALAWGRTRGTNQREQDPEEMCLPQELAPAARPCNAHGKYAGWEVSAGSGSFYVLDHYFLHKHLMKISERARSCQWRSFGLLWRAVMWTQCKPKNETGWSWSCAVTFWLLTWVLGAFSAFTWPSLGMDHESLFLLLAIMWNPWVHFRRIKLLSVTKPRICHFKNRFSANKCYIYTLKFLNFECFAVR